MRDSIVSIIRNVEKLKFWDRYSDREKVLRLLYVARQKAFRYGNTKHAWLSGAGDIKDAAPGLYKFAAIIHQLKKDGFAIDSRKIKGKIHSEYRLVAWPKVK